MSAPPGKRQKQEEKKPTLVDLHVGSRPLPNALAAQSLLFLNAPEVGKLRAVSTTMQNTIKSADMKNKVTWALRRHTPGDVGAWDGDRTRQEMLARALPPEGEGKFALPPEVGRIEVHRDVSRALMNKVTRHYGDGISALVVPTPVAARVERQNYILGEEIYLSRELRQLRLHDAYGGVEIAHVPAVKSISQKIREVAALVHLQTLQFSVAPISWPNLKPLEGLHALHTLLFNPVLVGVPNHKDDIPIACKSAEKRAKLNLEALEIPATWLPIIDSKGLRHLNISRAVWTKYYWNEGKDPSSGTISMETTMEDLLVSTDEALGSIHMQFPLLETLVFFEEGSVHTASFTEMLPQNVTMEHLRRVIISAYDVPMFLQTGTFPALRDVHVMVDPWLGAESGFRDISRDDVIDLIENLSHVESFRLQVMHHSDDIQKWAPLPKRIPVKWRTLVLPNCHVLQDFILRSVRLVGSAEVDIASPLLECGNRNCADMSHSIDVKTSEITDAKDLYQWAEVKDSTAVNFSDVSRKSPERQPPLLYPILSYWATVTGQPYAGRGGHYYDGGMYRFYGPVSKAS